MGRVNAHYTHPSSASTRFLAYLFFFVTPCWPEEQLCSRNPIPNTRGWDSELLSTRDFSVTRLGCDLGTPQLQNLAVTQTGLQQMKKEEPTVQIKPWYFYQEAQWKLQLQITRS